MSNLQKSPSPVPWKGLAQLGFGILYGVSPIDLIPDVVLILGWVDDAIAVPLFIGFSVLSFIRHRKLIKKSSSGIISPTSKPVVTTESAQKDVKSGI